MKLGPLHPDELHRQVRAPRLRPVYQLAATVAMYAVIVASGALATVDVVRNFRPAPMTPPPPTCADGQVVEYVDGLWRCESIRFDASGSAQYRSLAIDDGEGGEVATFSGETHDLSLDGHLVAESPPTLSGCSGSVVGSDQTAVVTVTRGGPKCVVTFAHPWQNPPSCLIATQEWSAWAFVTTATGASFGARPGKYMVSCVGR